MRVLLALLLGVVSLGCDPGYAVHGSVLRSDGSPVSGAAVTLSCPRRVVLRAERRSDARGAFSFSALGCLSRDCVVRATTDGGSDWSRIGTTCLGGNLVCSVNDCTEAAPRLTIDE